MHPTATTTSPAFDELLARLEVAVRGGDGPAVTATRVGHALRGLPPTVLAPAELTGDPDGPAGSLVHAREAFSVVALVLRPRQRTAVHDHVAWGAVVVLLGTEAETRYRDRGDHLEVLDRTTNPTGCVTAFAPPGDLHHVENASAEPAVSLHVYGADLRRTGSSVRRAYDLPVR